MIPASEPVIVNDKRGVRDEEPVAPQPIPVSPPPPTQVMAVNRREVLRRYPVGHRILINQVLYTVRKVTDKDLVLRPIWIVPATENPAP
jgi:hypothetical protein